MTKSLSWFYIILFCVVLLTHTLFAVFTCDTFSLKQNDVPYEGVIADREFYTVYVGGATQKEGFYQLEQGSTYYDLFVKADVELDKVHFSYDLRTEYKPDELGIVVVNPYIEGLACYAINVNSPPELWATDVIPAKVSQALSEYIRANGAFSNKAQVVALLATLGERYLQYADMFYVGQEYAAS